LRLFRKFAAVITLALSAAFAVPAPAQAIAGGELATSSDGMAAVYYGSQFICSGSIVDNYWVLTAKHCLYDGGVRRSDSFLNVRVKSLDRTSGGGVVYVSLSKVRDDNDIALMKLDRSANAEPVRLASANPTWNATLYVFGWGRTSPTSGASTKLRRATEIYMGRTTDSYGGLALRGYWDDGVTCDGDSGGPGFKLVDGLRYQVGVVSQGGPNCNDFTDFASVPESHDWIENVMANF